MADRSKSECALWYVRYHSPDYELCESEEAAARLGAGMMENGDCSVLGVQFPDGRTIDVDNWPAWDEAQRWMDAGYARMEEERARQPKPVMRKVCDPFNGWALEVKATEPEWVGRQ